MENKYAIAWRCRGFLAETYEDELPRFRCTLKTCRCDGPCDELDATEAGTDAMEFIEGQKGGR